MADFSEKSIRISPSVAGRYFLSAQYPDTLDKKGELTIDNTFDVPGLFGFTYERKVYWLYVKPGENIELWIEKNHKERPLTMQVGPFPEAQEAFNRLELGAALGQSSQLDSFDRDFERKSAEVMVEMGRRLAPFDELYKLGKMDDDFYEIVQLMVKNHYAEVLCRALVDETASLSYHPDSSGYNRELIDLVRKNWDFIFSIADYRDVKATRVPSYAGFYHTGF